MMDPTPGEVDQAVETATAHVSELQERIDQELDEGTIPPPREVDDIVQRADDVRDLTEEARDNRR
jgi:hypothetical protein